MLIKWKNSLGLILCLYLFGLVTSTKGQFSIELPNELSTMKLKEMWHPHLKQMLNDNNELEIIDSHRKIYQTSLLQLNKDISFLSSDSSSKMQCGCRFIKVVDPKLSLKSQITSTTMQINKKEENENLSSVKSIDTQVVNKKTPSYIEAIVESLKLNNILMSKIEATLESQHNPTTNVQGATMLNQLGVNLSALTQPTMAQIITTQNPIATNGNNQIPLAFLNTNGQVLGFVNNNIPVGYSNASPQLVANLNYLNNYSSFIK